MKIAFIAISGWGILPDISHSQILTAMLPGMKVH